MKSLRLVVVMAMLGSLAGCGAMFMSQQQKDAMAQANQMQMDMVGVISKGSPNMGMENTGWLFTPSQGGGPGTGMSIDVSQVKDQAEANVGKKVVIKATGFGAKPDAMVQPAMKVLSIETVGDGSSK
jgi:hypothetical protein